MAYLVSSYPKGKGMAKQCLFTHVCFKNILKTHITWMENILHTSRLKQALNEGGHGQESDTILYLTVWPSRI